MKWLNVKHPLAAARIRRSVLPLVVSSLVAVALPLLGVSQECAQQVGDLLHRQFA